MGGEHNIRRIVDDQKRGIAKGIYSICSHNRYVIEASVQQAAEDRSVVLIESTCNQVNQLGGYSGMTPMDFREYIFSIAMTMDFPVERIILGGDHLGPFPFQHENSASAMDKAREMVGQYVLTGSSKIHLDASMRLKDDPGGANTPLDPHIIADRCAELCRVAEGAYESMVVKDPRVDEPVYVIGTEVPAPGGSDEVEEGLKITEVSDFKETVSITKESFHHRNLHDAWERVIAVVVQPGIEYGDHTIIEYDREKARELTLSITEFPNLVFEGHSTDYQPAEKLRELVEDGVAILKVGPALTFAAREAVFMLNLMEEEILRSRPSSKLSKFVDTLDDAMVQNSQHWEKYYQGDAKELEFRRKYSLFDRARYYWDDKRVDASLKLLIDNLRMVDIPLSLISQFLPEQYRKLREGKLQKDPEAFIRDRIKDVLKDFSYAVGNKR